MQLSIPGVIVDGSSPVTATRARADVVVYQGEDVSVVVTVTGSNGTAFSLAGYTATLTLKDRLLPSQGTPKTANTYSGTIASNTATFTIPGTDLKTLLQVSYWWDVKVTSGAGKNDFVVLDSLMTVNPAVGA